VFIFMYQCIYIYIHMPIDTHICIDMEMTLNLLRDVRENLFEARRSLDRHGRRFLTLMDHYN